MDILLRVLAMVGVLAVARLLLRVSLLLGRDVLDAYVLRAVAEARAQRGDLTALNEAQQLRQERQRARFRRWGEFFGLLALLIVPPLTPYMLGVYAVYNVFWLVRRR